MAVRASRRPKPARCPAPAVQAPTLNQTAAEAHGERAYAVAGESEAVFRRAAAEPLHRHRQASLAVHHVAPAFRRRVIVGGRALQHCRLRLVRFLQPAAHDGQRSLTKPDGREGSTARHLGRRGQKKRASPDPPAAARASPRRSRPTAPLPPPASRRTHKSPPQSRTESARPHSTHCPHNHRHLNFFPLSVIPGRSEGCQRLTVLAVGSRSARRPHRRAARSLRTCVHTF